MSSANPIIFREYDIRGIVDKEFNKDFAYLLGKAHASFIIKKNLGRPVVCVGFDARHTGPELSEAIVSGLKSSGAKVFNLGLITTGLNYFSTFQRKEVNGAIMITGSHNPPEYNGFKISVGSSTISGKEIQDLRKIIEKKDFVKSENIGEALDWDIIPEYIKRYKKEFGSIKNFGPIVLDCGNGAAGSVVRKLYEAVGLKPHIIFEEPDGDFPNHHPDPTIPENLKTIIQIMKEKKAVLGIGFDGDADRIVLIDGLRNGRIIEGDELIALCAYFVLKEHPGSPIIGDVKCSNQMYTQIKNWGGRPVMWKSGHSLVKEKVRAEGSPFGGEFSGHVFFGDRNYGYDDALYAGLRIIEALSKSSQSIEDILKSWPKTFATKEIRLKTTEEKKHSIVEKIKVEFSKPSSDYEVNLLDGIRINFKHGGWALARASNTQAILTLRFEALTKSDLELTQKRLNDIIQPLL